MATGAVRKLASDRPRPKLCRVAPKAALPSSERKLAAKNGGTGLEWTRTFRRYQ
jgi:hypothetical protein